MWKRTLKSLIVWFLFTGGCFSLFSCKHNPEPKHPPKTTTPTDTKDVGFKSSIADTQRVLLQAYQSKLIQDYGAQWNARMMEYDRLTMPFYIQTFGGKPSDGYGLIISMHGGGNAAPSVNDHQYENQKTLYNGVFNQLLGLTGFLYLAPRAPTNTWNLWHESHIDEFFNRIIQLAVAKEGVNPNKVYLIGYSAGGDGVYQLAPRMAYRFAAASMMAGHPNDASPLGLRNLPFAIHVGALDNGYDRNKKALEWKGLLDDFEKKDPGGYKHQVMLHPELPHWMSLQEYPAFRFMFTYQRNPIPTKVVWRQSSRHHTRFYWLGTEENFIQNGGEIVATYDKSTHTVNIEQSYTNTIRIYLNDEMLDLDQSVNITYQGKSIYHKKVERSVETIKSTIADFGDPYLAFSVMLELKLF